MSDYSELKMLAEKATPGPWHVDSHGMTMTSMESFQTIFNHPTDRPAVRHEETGNLSSWRNDWDASFIAAANPSAVLALIAEVEALRSQVITLQSDANSWQSGYDEGRRMGTKTAMDERERLRREIAALKPSPVRIDKTTIGYTGCIICGQYTDHGGLQCPNLAARSLSMENQRIVPVESISVDHPLDAAIRQGAKQ